MLFHRWSKIIWKMVQHHKINSLQIKKLMKKMQSLRLKNIKRLRINLKSKNNKNKSNSFVFINKLRQRHNLHRSAQQFLKNNDRGLQRFSNNSCNKWRKMLQNRSKIQKMKNSIEFFQCRKEEPRKSQKHKHFPNISTLQVAHNLDKKFKLMNNNFKNTIKHSDRANSSISIDKCSKRREKHKEKQANNENHSIDREIS